MEVALEIDLEIFQAIKDFRLQSMGLMAVETIVDRLNLEPFHEFLGFNAGNDLPYHNYYHAACMVLNCYEGAHHSSLGEEETRGLCAAALLHDFNHLGGYQISDAENIAFALKGLRTAQAYASSMLLGLSPTSLKIAEESIKITEYPFIQEPKTIHEMIIRDADLMQPYDDNPDFLLAQYLGLKEEIEIRHGRTYTRKEFAEGQKNFLDKEVVWHTEWAIEKAKARNWEMVKSDLAELISISAQ